MASLWCYRGLLRADCKCGYRCADIGTENQSYGGIGVDQTAVAQRNDDTGTRRTALNDECRQHPDRNCSQQGSDRQNI